MAGLVSVRVLLGVEVTVWVEVLVSFGEEVGLCGMRVLTGVFKGCCVALGKGVAVGVVGVNCAASSVLESATPMAEMNNTNPRMKKRQAAKTRCRCTRNNVTFCPEGNALMPSRRHTSAPIPAMIGKN